MGNTNPYQHMSQDDLDDLVHDAKSLEASDINNAGREAQIAYLTGENTPRVIPAPSTDEGVFLRCDVADKKYTVIMENDGRLHALRYGEPWKELTGQKMVYCLAYELSEARQEAEALRGDVASLTDEVEALREKRAKLILWVNDLQSRQYVNCVYCGHRYGPSGDTPVSQADVLKEHIENCPEHPMSKLKQRVHGVACSIQSYLMGEEVEKSPAESWIRILELVLQRLQAKDE